MPMAPAAGSAWPTSDLAADSRTECDPPVHDINLEKHCTVPYITPERCIR